MMATGCKTRENDRTLEVQNAKMIEFILLSVTNMIGSRHWIYQNHLGSATGQRQKPNKVNVYCFRSPWWQGWLEVVLLRPGQSIVSSLLCLGKMVLAATALASRPKSPTRLRVKSGSEIVASVLRRPRFQLTPRLIRWELTSSSHFVTGRIVELFPKEPQIESWFDPNEHIVDALMMLT